jgi:CheY-like chemotaxis protein
VDEESNGRAQLSRHLAGDGFAVLEAANGRQAIAMVKQTACVDLVITDLGMAEPENLETVAKLREIHPQVKVIAIAEMPGEKAHVAERLGAAVTLRKPVSGEALLGSVQAVLGQ